MCKFIKTSRFFPEDSQEGYCQEHSPICQSCAKEDLCLSEITLRANYGSVHDGECLTILLCGECFDKLYKAIIENNLKGE